MKNRFNLFLAAILVSLPAIAPAAVLYWDGTDSTADADGGSGDWDTLTTAWDDAATAGLDTYWPTVSTGDDDAVFGVVGGIVNIQSAGVTANDLTFGVAGYTLSGGTLALDGATNVLTVTPNANNAATISAPIAAPNGIMKSGSGLLTINGANPLLAGTVTVSNPPVATNNGGLLFSGADSIGPVTTFNINGSGTTADGGWLALANGATIPSGATVNLSGQGGNAAPPGTLRCTGGTATVNGTVNLLTGNVRISCSSGTELKINGAISDGANSFGILFRFGDNQGVHLTNTSNAWDGDTVLGQGVLRAEPGALPSGSRLQIAGSASGWFQTYGSLTRPLGTASGSGVIDMASNATNKVVGIGARGGDLTVNFGGNGSDVVWGSTPGFNPAILGLNNSTADSKLTLVNPLDLNGAARLIQVDANTVVLQGGVKNSSATAASLRKTGAGTLEHDPGAATGTTLTGLNTGGGTTRLTSGTYTITGSASTSAPDGTTGFIVSRGGTFHLNGANVTCTGGSYVFPAGNTNGGSSRFVLDSGLLDGGAKEVLNAYGANGTTVINGGLFICGDFRVGQSSTCRLELNGGTLRTNRLKDANATTATVLLNGGTLQAKQTQASFIDSALDNVLVQAGGVIVDSNGYNITIPRPLAKDTGSPGGGLTKMGAGILDLTSANGYTGENLIEGGVLRVSDNAQLGDPAASVTLNGGQFGVSGTAIPSVSSLGRTFTYITGGFHVAEATHTFDVDIALTGWGGLSKSGPGTVRLSGTNTYAGTTAVNDGKLLVDGNSSAATGDITVGNNGVLGGGGTLGGPVTLDPLATLAPGNSAGTLTTTGNVGGTGTLAIEIDGATADKLAVTGSGVIDISGMKLTVSALAGGSTLPVYLIVDSAMPITGSAFASVSGVPAGYAVVYNYNDGSDSNNIALVAGASGPYDTWAGANGLAGGNAAPTADPDHDGLANGIEFVLGGQPNPSGPGPNSSALAPTVSADGPNLVFTYRRTDVSATQSGIVIRAEYGSTLGGWTPAIHGVSGISVAETNDYYGPGVDRVVVTIPKSLAVGSKIFARLSVTLP